MEDEQQVMPEQEQEKKKETEEGPKRKAPSVFAEMGDAKIYQNNPLPQYDSGPVKAYEASVGQDKIDDGYKYYALICEPDLVPRRRASIFYKDVANPALVSLVRSGVCYWPPAREERFVLVYQVPRGKPLVPLGEDQYYLGWKLGKITDCIIRPVVSALHEFNEKEFYHGAVRLSNMFYVGDDVDKNIVLGDCLSSPPAFLQPAIYETIPRALADPCARGPGTAREDLYSLGVSLALIMCPETIITGLSDEQIIKKKIEMGSYAALVGNERFSGPSLELLRGLLQDDDIQRWGMEDILGWLDGRRLSPQQFKKSKQAMRTLKFAGKKYISIYPLALDFHKHKEEACNLIDSGELEDWLNRSVEDKDAAERLQLMMTTAQAHANDKTPSVRREFLVSIAKMALAPSLPIYYKEMHMACEGIGMALARVYVQKGELRPFHEMLRDKVPVSWFYVQEGFLVNASKMQSLFEACRQSVRLTRIGEGLERCLYMLCVDVPCLSQKLEGFYIRNATDMMNAFELLSQKSDTMTSYLDRHSAAFLSVRDSKIVEAMLFDLNSPERHRQVLAELKVFAAIQKRYKLNAYPHIASSFLRLLPPVYERFHDRDLRGAIEKQVSKHARNGDLIQMAETLDDLETKSVDSQRFRLSMQEYKALVAEQKQLEKGLANRGTFGRVSGHNVSVIMSGILATILTLLVLFSWLSGNTYF